MAGRAEWDHASTSTSGLRLGVRCRVSAPTDAVNAVDAVIQPLLATLRLYESKDGKAKVALHEEAMGAAKALKEIIAEAVNSKSTCIRTLQTNVSNSGAVRAILHTARMGEPLGYETLQILCYRNAAVCQQIVAEGVVDRIAIDMPTAGIELQCSMCHLLTALVAFNESAHKQIAASGLIPQLVAMCRMSCRLRRPEDDVHTPEMLQLLENRAAAVLRNLSHNTLQHQNLLEAGAVDALADIMRHCENPKSRINAALAVAILVGHEENNPKLQLDEALVENLLDVLKAASQGTLYLGVFWTVWKLCQGLANLAVNDKNKELITARGGVQLMAGVLFGKHHNNEVAHRYALSAIWNLAFNDDSRRVIMEVPGLVDAIRDVLASTESPKTKEVAKGALWTLGLEQDIKSLTENNSYHAAEPGTEAGAGGHIMLSYEWGQQQSVLLIKSELEKEGYQTWMDVDKMSGSTLEAMAKAVEGSAVVLVCVSKKYKESQACRTEAEYAFQQRKKIVPILMERSYKPTGWLGALIGTRMHFDMCDPKRIPAKSTALCKELGGAGKLPSAGGSLRSSQLSVDQLEDSPENWSHAEVQEWLKKIKCSEYGAAFKEKDMDGMALSGLLRMSSDRRHTHDVLISELGITSIGHRLRLIEEMHRLFA